MFWFRLTLLVLKLLAMNGSISDQPTMEPFILSTSCPKILNVTESTLAAFFSGITLLETLATPPTSRSNMLPVGFQPAVPALPSAGFPRAVSPNR